MTCSCRWLLFLVLASMASAVAGAGLDAAGDKSMAPLMDSWLAALRKHEPGIARGANWRFVEGGSPVGALLFETADVAALARKPSAAELAPYAHQFAGDMMKSPLLVRVAGSEESPAYLALNKRPDSPLPPKVKEFAAFALSREGQEIVARDGVFRPLTEAEAAAERAKLQGFVASLDPRLPSYRAGAQVRGDIRSVGSDGMKSLMDRWMRDFRRVQPGVRKGERWEHLGTLNGFHALIAGETDIAPMGRELWPSEAAIYEAAQGRKAPLEIRVARGGFNTPQRTTAQAIFVNERNPLARITVPQLAAILGERPTITRWGQLGLEGEWADRPIAIYMPPRAAPNSMSMQMRVLKGGAWNSAASEGAIAKTAAAIASDPGAIGFGGLEEGGPGLKALAVAAAEGAPYFALDADNASSGRYPLTRYMYIRLSRAPGAAVPPAVKEFLRYILSRDGQEPILYSGYFPLRADEVAQELAKLD
jgi:ABC-type phosphate transport system substrate-binding protein